MNLTATTSSPGRGSLNEFKVSYICVHACLTVATIFGNYLVIRAFIQFPHLRTASNSILVSLSIADLLMVAVFISRLVSDVVTGPKRKVCFFISILNFTLNANIILHLALISTERLIAVKYALRYHTMVTNRRALLASIGVWLFAILPSIAFPQALRAERRAAFREFIGGLTPCLFRPRKGQNDFSLKSNSVLAYLIFLVTVQLLLPIANVVISHGYIFKVAYKQRKQIIQSELTLHPASLTMKREMKAARSVAILVGLCLFSFVPLLVILCLHFFSASVPITKRHLTIAYIVASMNACWNPLIYCWRSQHFRTAFKRLLKCNHQCCERMWFVSFERQTDRTEVCCHKQSSKNNNQCASVVSEVVSSDHQKTHQSSSL